MFREHIEQLCERFRQDVFAGEYRYEVVYGGKGAETTSGLSAMAAIDCCPTYLDARIYVYDLCYEYWKRGEYRQIANGILHEWCHVLTEPLYRAALPAYNKSMQDHLEDIRERQTQRICNALMELMPDDAWMPKTSKTRSGRR